MVTGKKIFFVFSIDYMLISHRRRLVEAVVAAGNDVTVVAQDTGYADTIREMGCQFVELPINRVGTNIREELKTFRFLKKLYKKEKPDIIHHVSLKVTLWGGLAAKMVGAKCVVNAINGLGVFFSTGKADTLVKKVLLKFVGFAHRHRNMVTIFQNSSDKALFVDSGAIRDDQCRYIKGSGVDLNDFAFTPEPEGEVLNVVFTSRMVKEKGVIDIVDAALMLKDKYAGKVRFLLCGLIETNPQAISEAYLNEVCDGEYLKYMGHCSNIRDILRQSAIVLLPSYYREGVPKSVIEATAIGRPVITTDWVGCRETVDDGVNGFLIPIKSPEKLAEKLSILLDDKQLRTRMGKASREKAEREFSIDIVIEKHFAIYEELLKNS
ncbi:MAG: glycosyltransferase family 4 protein [Bacteroidales bacterium]|nr:glycosyltransferase family 4 protein [Bacteroidales bacterium]